MQCGLLALSIVFLLHTAHATTTTVHVGPGGGLTFTPDPVFIQPGDTVEWVWDASGHSATSGTPGTPDGIFDSGLQSVGFIFSFTFPDPGSFPYYCTRHGAMMVGTVNVVAATPSPTPTPSTTPNPTATATATIAPVNISGTITYCSNPSLNPVPNVTLNLTGDTTASTLSDGSGNYLFSSLASGGNYTVTPAKAALPPGSTGINTVDVIAVQRHFLSLGTPLSGCRLTAADVNSVGGVNTVDVVAIQRFFLTLSTGIANVGKYQFTPVNRSYPGVVTNQTAQNYNALIFGDVASSFVHRPQAGDGLSADEVPVTVATVALPDVAVDQSRVNFIAAVKTSEIDAKNNLVGFQGDFTFDSRVVSFESEPVQNAGITGGDWNVSGNVLAGTGPIRTLRVSAFSNDFAPSQGWGHCSN